MNKCTIEAITQGRGQKAESFGLEKVRPKSNPGEDRLFHPVSRKGIHPPEQIRKQRRIPLLDIGTMKLIKQGHIKVYGDIVRIDGNDIFFEENKQANFDAIILAAAEVFQ